MDEKSKLRMRRNDLRGNYESIRCPAGCGRLLFEVSARQTEGSNIEMKCFKCAQRILPSVFYQAEGESDSLIAGYRCHNCGTEYEKIFDGTREKCKGCNKFQNVFMVGRSGMPVSIEDRNRAA